MAQSIDIDVSKGKLDAGLINSDQTTRNLQCGNDHKSIPSLVKTLQYCQDIRDIPIVIEATGGYHYGITFALIDKGFKKVFVINPIITKKHLSSQIKKIKILIIIKAQTAVIYLICIILNINIARYFNLL